MGSIDNDLLESVVADFKPLDAEDFRKQAHKMVDFIADYYRDIEKYPVCSQVQPGYLRERLPETAPYHPEPLDDILRDIQTQIIPGITHWLSPSFFAYFPASASTAAFLGEMLCTCFNIVGFNWLASPAATELESVVIDWLAELLKLPKPFTFSGGGGGVIQGTTSESMLCTLVAARDRALTELGRDKLDKLVVYGSDQTHSTFQKACKIAGINPKNIRSLPTTIDSGFSLSPRVLRKTIEDDVASGLFPLYICATLGTTSSTAVDPLDAIGDVAKDYRAWFHVDAAYAGSACICPEFRHFLDGVEKADSLSMSPHKWLLTYLDCCCLWVKQPSFLLQSLSTDPEYLRNKPSDSKMVVDYKDWQVGVGRRFRALRLWLVLRSHGVANLQSHIRSDVRMAKYFEGLVRSDMRFEIVLPRKFSLVCFRLRLPAWKDDSGGYDDLNRKLLEAVNSAGKMYVTHTVVGGVYMLRFAIGASLTEEKHVTTAWKYIQEKADGLVKGGSTGETSSV